MRFYEPDLAVNFGYLIWVTSEMLKETYKTKQKGDCRKGTVIAYACRIVCVCKFTYAHICLCVYVHVHTYTYVWVSLFFCSAF